MRDLKGKRAMSTGRSKETRAEPWQGHGSGLSARVRQGPNNVFTLGAGHEVHSMSSLPDLASITP
jgi:hypothetical protein